MSRTPRSYWVLGASLVAYVAICTAQRDRIWEADAWEHDRAVRAFASDLVMPGNPTYATAEPSIRYSLYTVALAGLVRLTAIDAFDALSLAAVFNTAFLVVAVWLLLKRFGEVAAASCVLLVMIGLWGGPPGYANSYALTDLPWHQVNPSAFSFPLVLCVWALYLRAEWSSLPAMMLLSGIALNTHPMTGAFGLYGLVLLAFSGSVEQLSAQVLRFVAVLAASFVACVLWPWYDFIEALRSHRDQLYWFNPSIVRITLLSWCAPAVLGAVLALSLVSRESVRRCLLCAAGVFALTILTLPLRSATLARFPVPGMIFLHIAIGVMVYESRILDWRAWPERIRTVIGSAGREPPPARVIVEIAIAGVLLFYTVPQVIMIGTEWHLGKAYVAQVLGRSDEFHPHLKPRFDRLFDGIVKPSDVVLSDVITSWPIPSSGGKIVAAVHYEAFVDGQTDRVEAVHTFFGESQDVDRAAILNRYNVRYIVMNRDHVSPSVWQDLLRERAVLRRHEGLVLMSAERWRGSKAELAAHLE
ncbi:MAG TPA: hypothetical protein VFG30_32765 [Polyangiales bacterium]|nr:hypothetical protein [Polyangiales bacterium]